MFEQQFITQNPLEMKKLFFAAFIISALAFKSADAQLSIHLNLNIGSQPDWGPTGYDHADYYYMPDIDCYYDVAHSQYVYPNGNTWVRASVLPARYHNYDVYSGYKVVINQPTPYLHANVYRAKYASFKGRKGQAVIRDSHDAKYRNNRPQHGQQQGRQDQGHQGNGHDNNDHSHDNDRH
jgi:hypothetical protein